MKIIRITAIFAMLLLVTLNVSAQEDACYAKDGIWDASTTKCTVKSGYEIDVNYPLSIAQYPFAVGRDIQPVRIDVFKHEPFI